MGLPFTKIVSGECGIDLVIYLMDFFIEFETRILFGVFPAVSVQFIPSS